MVSAEQIVRFSPADDETVQALIGAGHFGGVVPTLAPEQWDSINAYARPFVAEAPNSEAARTRRLTAFYFMIHAAMAGQASLHNTSSR